MEATVQQDTGLEVEIRDGLARCRMNFDAVNSLDADALARLGRIFRELANDSTVRVVILESARPGWFSNGLNLDYLHGHPGRVSDFMEHFFGTLEALYRLPVPVVAVIGGHCMGYGTMLALLSDYRLMADGKFRISLPEANLGIRVPVLIALALKEIVNGPLARDMMLLGTALKPAEAAGAGLVDELHGPDELDAKAARFARRFANLSITGTRASKTAARDGIMHRLEEILEQDKREAAENIITPDAREGISAFVEKRRPSFA